ncbi:MAG: bifunctional metallophosphatase/5'-nucleotidase [Candidatus Aminicenantes bacterium]|nr:bifunctional metallophosphatase/5'-nucleotidase [Candidatus Aminicenantes bacterium]
MIAAKILRFIFLASLLIFSLDACRRNPSGSGSLLIIHSNDTHGTYLPYTIEADGIQRMVGGMEAVSHYLNVLRNGEKNVLLIDTGDVMTGTLATKLEYRGAKGGVMMEFMNLLGYDVWCPGNHAFDQGQENVKALVKLASFPTVLCNLVYEGKNELFFPEAYHIFEIGSMKVGVIGVIEEKFKVEVDKKSTIGLEVHPVIATLKPYVDLLDKQTDLLIVLAHGRFDTAEQIAQDISGIDVILVAQENGRFEVVNDVLLKSTLGHQRTLGTLHLEVGKDKIVEYDEDMVRLWADIDLKPAPEIKALVLEFKTLIDSEYGRVIGECREDRTRKGYPVESALGNWITDAMRWKTGAEVAFQNSGGIRADISSGPITVADIYEISPFNNTLVLFELTGQQIKDGLETDVERDWDRLQVSGITYAYHPKEVRPFGHRVESVEVGGLLLVQNGKVLHPDRVYTAVTNDYVFGQAQAKYFGYPLKSMRDTELPLNQALMDWLAKNKLLVCEIEGRIVVLK